MSTEQQRQQWRELAAAATPGDWFAYWSQTQVATVQIPSGWLFQSSDKGTMADAAFIAAARAAVPQLLADVDALTQERDALAAELERVRAQVARFEEIERYYQDRNNVIAETGSRRNSWQQP